MVRTPAGTLVPEAELSDTVKFVWKREHINANLKMRTTSPTATTWRS